MNGIKKGISLDASVFIAMVAGIVTGCLQIGVITKISGAVSQIFVNLLQLISLPIIFFSLVSTLSGIETVERMKTIGRKFVTYTFLTTFIAAVIALCLYHLIAPTLLVSASTGDVSGSVAGMQQSYLQFILSIIPSNAVQAFGDNHKVMSVVFMAVGLGVAILHLEDKHKKPLTDFFGAFFAVILQITQWIMVVIPFGVWAFIDKFVGQFGQSFATLKTIGWYALCVVVANLVQGFIVLPLFLKYKGLSPKKTFYGMLPALVTAFVSKSSNIALPFSMQCSQINLGVSQPVSSIGFPLCSVINMNGCAAFILLTVLFVASSAGIHFTMLDQCVWLLIATLAAVGNAGVPMGCFFLSTALLNGMGVPVDMMMLILPLYTLIDMLETAVNVWSDSCIVAVVNKEL